MKLKFNLLAQLFLFTAGLAYGQDTLLKKAWEKFNQNDRDASIELFKQAITNPTTKSDAALGLSLVLKANDKNEEAFNAFIQFFNSSSNPYPYTYALWTSGCVFKDYDKKNAEQLKFLERLTNDPQANGTLKAMAWSMLGSHYKEINKIDESKKSFNMIGALENWESVGPFENISASGFNKNWGPLEHPEPSSVFINKVNAEVKWFPITSLRNDKWLDFEFHYEAYNSIIYAQTFVTSEKAIDAFIRSGNSGSEKIWVNDKLVTNIDDERNCDLDVYINTIKLNQGVNRILVQIGESDAGNSNIMVRITDEFGNNIQGISSSNKYQSYTKASDYVSATIPFWAESYFEQKVKNNSSDLVNYLLLAETYLRNDKSFETKRILKQARELAPASSFINVLFIESYKRDGNNAEKTKLEEYIKTNDPDNTYALGLRINEEGNKENYDEQEKILEKYISIYGKSLYTDALYIGLLGNRNQIDAILKTSEELFKKYPDNFEVIKLKYLLELQKGKDLLYANKILTDFCKLRFNENVYSTIAENYFKLGNKNEAIKILLERVEKFPNAVGYQETVANVYFSLENYSEALKWNKLMISNAPYHGYYWAQLGKVYEAMKDIENAKNAYRKAINFQPTNYSAREQLRKLEGKESVWESFENEDVYALFKKSPKSEEFPEDHSMILLNDIQRVVYPEGGTEIRTEYLIKVLNKSGIDNWKEYTIGFNSYLERLIIEKAEVLKSNGSKVQAEKNENQIVFTNLEVNDAIHISYRIEDYSSGKLAHHFFDEYNFNLFYPIGIARYNVLIPKDMKFNYTVRKVSDKPIVKDIDDFKMYTWEAKNLSAVKEEQYMPMLDGIGSVLEISSIPDWNYVAEWYADLSNTKTKADFEVKEALAEIFKNKNPKSEYEQAKMIYEYIENNIRYSNISFMHSAFVPQKPSRTISNKLGDCKDVSLLFVTMCKERGIKANLVLVDTRDNGELDFVEPCINFNHCIATANLDGKQFYIELTDNYLSFGAMHYTLKNAISLVIPQNGEVINSSMKPLVCSNRPPNQIFRESEISMDGSDVNVKRKTTRWGFYASGTRETYANLGKEQQEKEMSEVVSSDFNNPIKFQTLNFKDLKSLSDSIVYDYSFKVLNEVKDVVGIKLLKLPWTDAYLSLDFVNADNRVHPFEVWLNDACELRKEIMTITLPKGKIIAEMPSNVSYSCSAYDYVLSYKQLPGKLIATRTINLKKETLTPEEYHGFKDFCKKVAEADGKGIAYK